MLKSGIRNLAVKAMAMLSAAVVCAGIAGSYIKPVEVSADEGLYHSLYDVFRDRSDDPENFMSQELFIKRIFWNCEALWGINYTYGDQEHNLGCDGFVSLVFRLTFGTAYDFKRTEDKYWVKFDYHEEHIVAASNVDQYEIFRPGGTSVTWLYKNYPNEIVEPLVDRTFVEGMDDDEWVDFMEDIGAQPGDIMLWDDDDDDKFWTHVGIYAGIEDGVPMMWHASSIKGEVVKQSLGEITSFIQYLDYVCILPTTPKPAKVGLYVDSSVPVEKDFSYSVYRDADCTEFIGRLTNVSSSNGQSSLGNVNIYPNQDESAFERTIYIRKEVTPYTTVTEDQEVFQLIIRIEPNGDGKGTLKYSVYGASDIRFYFSKELINYDYYTGYKVIEITEFR